MALVVDKTCNIVKSRSIEEHGSKCLFMYTFKNLLSREVGLGCLKKTTPILLDMESSFFAP